MPVSASLQRDEPEVAIFRFTLGIPGFDDALLPRVVSVLGSILLVVNHVAASVNTEAAARTEALGAVAAVICFCLPSLGSRFEEVQTSGDYSAASRDTKELFALQSSFPRYAQEELAWATLALLQNTGSSGCLIRHRGKSVCLRGFWRPPAAGAAGPQLLADFDGAAAGLLAPGAPEVFVGERHGSNSDAVSSALLSAAAESVLQCSSGQTEMVLYSCTPRAFTARKRQWALSVVQKVAAVLDGTSAAEEQAAARK